jgi:hypothetical protein
MATPLHILHLEDDPSDALLIRETLEHDGIDAEVKRVCSRAEFVSAIEQGDADLILSDYALPQFDGISALAIARREVPDTPFILVSGTLGEDAAVESLRSGATDYVLKTRMNRLAPAVRRAVEELEQRRTRRAVERALERERKFLRALLESLESGVMACDQDGALTLINRATRELCGMTGDAAADGWPAEVRLLGADGRTPLEPGREPLERARRGEVLRSDELTIALPGAMRVVLASGQPIVDDLGTRLGAVVTLEDVTERRHLERQLRQAQRMEAMGKLAAGVAHDFNNLLTVINGYCHLARSGPKSMEEVTPHLEEIAKAGERAADLTRQLLAFSRQQVLEPRLLDLSAVVSEMEKMVRRVIGADIELVFRAGRDLGRIHADVGQMEQVLLNLIVNARDAMEKGGTITVETANVEVDSGGANLTDGKVLRRVAGPLSFTPDVPAGHYATLTVTDTGCGMDADTASRIFEPFFTTKEAGRGTGLGLSTVHGIVTQSGGHIEVHSEPGRGACFRVYLPRAKAGAETDGPAAESSPPQSGTETILVVDDDQVLLHLVSEILTLQGYTVLQAGSGNAALGLLADRGRKIDAVVTDVVMPGLSGREVAQRLESQWPDLPIVFMSGYLAESPDQVGSLLVSRVAFLQKPFSPEVLLERVRAVLDGKAAEAA